MPLITTESIVALAHCAQMAGPGERCPGFAQAEVPGVRETVAYTYRDGWGGVVSSDPVDVLIGERVERSSAHLNFADEADRACPVCGAPREISDQVRPVYARLSEADPDELLRRERSTANAAVQAATAADRQAVALEALAAQAERNGEIDQLRALVERQSAQIDALIARADTEPANGHASKPRRRAEG